MLDFTTRYTVQSDTGVFTRYLTQKQYELSDHLGNVRTVVKDVKYNVNSTYVPDIASYQNYYAFGMLQEERMGSASTYRYGYNGKEKDDEVKGEGNSIDFGARVYDAQIARFLSRDRFTKKYPFFSEYIYASNQPITHIDDNGDYAIYHHYAMTRTALEKLGVSTVQSRLIGHYASVYADNPNENKGLVTANKYLGQTSYPGMAADMDEDLRYKQSIDYSGTIMSQSTDPKYQAWHGCKGVGEKISSVDAMKRTASFAWEKLFSSASRGDLRTFQENSVGIQELGQSLHAWQDIFAHGGVTFIDGNLDPEKDPHDEVNDIFPDPQKFKLAKLMTENMLRVHQILTGNFSNVGNGQQIVTLGMSPQQVQTIQDRLTSAGYTTTSDSNGNVIANIPKR